MIISYYGRKFLKKYNEVEKKNLTPKEFFVDVFYPLFYGGEKNLMEATNSPFTNAAYYLNFFVKADFEKNNMKWKKDWFSKGKFMWDDIPDEPKKYIQDNLLRYKKERTEFIINKFFEKIEKKEFDASMFLGGYAADKEKISKFTQTTSFNIPTQYNHNIDENEIYYSWIGNALAFQFYGIYFLFDNENILYDTYLGWKRYAELLSDPLYADFKGSQIATWNTHWLSNYYSLVPTKKFNPLAETKEKLESVSWVRLLFYISIKYPQNLINAYAYKFGQTNETYGIIVLETKKIDGFLNFCKEYFGDNNFLNHKGYETIYGTGYSIEKICEFGSIGMVALKPELLRMEEYCNKTADVQKKIKNRYNEAIENNFYYKLYNIYLMAKLNLKDIQKDVIEIADSLYNFQCDTRKNSKGLVEDILSATNMSIFQKKMSEAMKVCVEQKLPQHAEMFNKLMNLALSDETKLSDLIFFIKFNYHKIEIEKNK